MSNYWLFLTIAVAAIFSPGPGVLLTLTNAIRYGASGAIAGILGISTGTFIVAGVCATSLGVLLTMSAVAFNAIKYMGAVYLIYLGTRMWRSPIRSFDQQNSATKNRKKQFLEGLTVQVTNPKAVLFFMAIFPQFIDYSSDYLTQFLQLVVTYGVLVLLIHGLYACAATAASHWFASDRGSFMVNRAGGGLFVLFGVGLASSSK